MSATYHVQFCIDKITTSNDLERSPTRTLIFNVELLVGHADSASVLQDAVITALKQFQVTP